MSVNDNLLIIFNKAQEVLNKFPNINQGDLASMCGCSVPSIRRAYAMMRMPVQTVNRKDSAFKRKAELSVKMFAEYDPVDRGYKNRPLTDSQRRQIADYTIEIKAKYDEASVSQISDVLGVDSHLLKTCYGHYFDISTWPFKLNSRVKTAKPVQDFVLATKIKNKERKQWINIQRAIMGVSA
jgi:hypothetical protein